jgi:hypothetical protein
MNKNPARGRDRRGASRWHNTPKASGMPVKVNAAAVQWSNVSLPGEICSSWRPPKAVAPEAERREREMQKSAEAIVIEETSRGLQDARLNYETGGLTRRRAEPIGSVLTAWRTVVTVKASRLGDTESRHDGKHVSAQDGASASFSRKPTVCV